jgi:hypothetical protein
MNTINFFHLKPLPWLSLVLPVCFVSYIISPSSSSMCSTFYSFDVHFQHYAYNSFKVAFLPYWCIATIVLMLLCDIFQFRLCCLWGNWLSPLFCCQAGDKGVVFSVVCFLSTLSFFIQKSFLQFLYFLLFLFLTWRFSFVFLLARKVGGH